jgi:hypothetical protein
MVFLRFISYLYTCELGNSKPNHKSKLSLRREKSKIYRESSKQNVNDLTNLDALFFFFRPIVALNPALLMLENVILHVPTRNVKDFLKSSVWPTNKRCPSARCAYAANVVGKDLDIFTIGAVSLNHNL